MEKCCRCRLPETIGFDLAHDSEEANTRSADVIVGSADSTLFVLATRTNSHCWSASIWIQDGRLFCDTKNHRVMVWNSIPTKNNTRQTRFGPKRLHYHSNSRRPDAGQGGSESTQNPVSALVTGTLSYGFGLHASSFGTQFQRRQKAADMCWAQNDHASDGLTVFKPI